MHAGLAHAMAEIWGKINGFGHLQQKSEQKRDLKKKQFVWTCRLFPQIFTKKSQVWALGTDWERIWPFQIFGYLDVWAKKRIMTGTQQEIQQDLHTENSLSGHANFPPKKRRFRPLELI